jgi:hypothetical protein
MIGEIDDDGLFGDDEHGQGGGYGFPGGGQWT